MADTAVTYARFPFGKVANAIPGLLADDAALVTGAAQGNGAAIAKSLAASGAAVVLCDVNLAAASQVSAEINKAGGRSIVIALDVANRAQAAEVVAKAKGEFGPISILINNAGIFRKVSMDDEGFLDSASDQFRVNVEGSLNMAHALLPQLRKTRGRIVNVASIAAFIAYRRNVVGYAASKGAVVQMTKGLAADLAQDGIRVNAIAPGLIATPMTVASRSNPTVTEELFQHALVKRFAEPEELVGAVLFLSSQLSSFVTGVTLPVDGGFIAI